MTSQPMTKKEFFHLAFLVLVLFLVVALFWAHVCNAAPTQQAVDTIIRKLVVKGQVQTPSVNASYGFSQ